MTPKTPKTGDRIWSCLLIYTLLEVGAIAPMDAESIREQIPSSVVSLASRAPGRILKLTLKQMIVINSKNGMSFFGVVVHPINNILRNRVDWNIVSSIPRTRRKCRGFNQSTGIPHNRLQQTVLCMSAVLSALPLLALIQVVYLTSFDRIDSTNKSLQSAENRIILKKTNSYCHVSRSIHRWRLLGGYRAQSV